MPKYFAFVYKDIVFAGKVTGSLASAHARSAFAVELEYGCVAASEAVEELYAVCSDAIEYYFAGTAPRLVALAGFSVARITAGVKV